jgi:AmmeMemoRadiSam system protein B
MTIFPAPPVTEIVRPPQFAGVCYPNNAQKLSELLDSVIKTPHHLTLSGSPVQQGAKAIIVPHIDFRVGLCVYGPAYYALQDSDADVFVIFATSHYGWGELFIPTFQHFSTPLGTLQTDHELLKNLQKKLPNLTNDDSAHREEHSIEFETVFLQHLFGHRSFTILPILVTSFYPFIQRQQMPAKTDVFARFCDALREVLRESGKKVAFVASADMAHIGRKFDDPYDAAPMLPAMHTEDMQLLSALEQSNASEYFHRIADVGDRFKICGLPPVYSMLETVRCFGGTSLAYEQWNEKATRSAVTYSSLAYYDAVL